MSDEAHFFHVFQCFLSCFSLLRLKRFPSWSATIPSANSQKTIYSSWRGNMDMKDDEQIDYFQPTVGTRSSHTSNGIMNNSRTNLVNNNSNDDTKPTISNSNN